MIAHGHTFRILGETRLYTGKVETPHIANWVVRPGRAPGSPGVYGFITVMCSSEASAVLVREPTPGVWFFSTMSEYRPG